MYNLMIDHFTANNWPDVKAELAGSKSGLVVCINANDSASAIGRTLEVAKVFKGVTSYRKYIPDNAAWQGIPPARFVEMHEDFAGTGIFVLAENEPAWNDQVLDWLYEVGVEGIRSGVRLILGNWSVGVPDHNQWRNPKALRLLKLIADNPMRLKLGLHEYFQTFWTRSITNDHRPESWPAKISPDVTLHHVGRFRTVIRVARENGIVMPPGSIAITEHGPDILFDLPEKDCKGAPTCIGKWQVMGYQDWQEYLYRNVQACWDVIYKPSLEVCGVAYYCMTDNLGQYGEYNVFTMSDFRDLYRKGNFMQTTSTPTSPLKLGRQKFIGETVNFRPAPNTSETFIPPIVIKGGDIVTVLGASTKHDGNNTWQKVRFNDRDGYVAINIGRWEELPPTNDSARAVLMNEIARLRAAADALEIIALTL
jgi:hypothetical protein